MTQRNFKIEEKKSPWRANLVGKTTTFTVNAEIGSAITVNIVLKDHNGVVVVEPCAVRYYLSDQANGLDFAATAPTSANTVGAHGAILDASSKKEGTLICDANGLIDFVLTDTAHNPFYLVLVMPSGALKISPLIQTS